MVPITAILALDMALTTPAHAAGVRVARLGKARNPWQRIEFDVYVELQAAHH